MKLAQVRKCDGACCRSAPAFPEKVGDRECKHRDPTTPEKGCKVMRKEVELNFTDAAHFRRVCLMWPQATEFRGRDTGDCCWQWVDE